MANKEQTIHSKFLKPCDLEDALQEKVEPFTIVIFGGTGDLSKRKLIPTLYHLFKDKAMPEKFSIIGIGRSDLTDAAYREIAHQALQTFMADDLTDELWLQFQKHLFFQQLDLKQTESYNALNKRILDVTVADTNKIHNVLYYFAVPPTLTPLIVANIGKTKITRHNFSFKAIIEKPFGTDRPSAIALNNTLKQVFSENEIFRIDHYLGKETVQNILFFRFANSIFEPLWNYRYIDNVQITVAEDIGIEHRGAFYEETGILRDIIQNHMMQLIALVAMEPPVGFQADLVRDEKVKVYNSIRPFTEDAAHNYVCGQYSDSTAAGSKIASYRKEKNVAANSITPTFIAGKFFIDNWRWAGVPFYIRSGKRLKKRITEIVIQFKQPPLRLFGKTCDSIEPNILKLTIQPEEEIILNLGIKYPQITHELFPADMRFNYNETFNLEKHEAYERLILDCLRGDLTLFARQDGIEKMWEIVDPLIQFQETTGKDKIHFYEANSWGPDAANTLLFEDGHKWFTV